MQKLRIDTFAHIAIVQTAFLGDTALALFLAEQIRMLTPDSRLTFVTTPQATPIAELCRAIDRVVPYNKRDKNCSALEGIRSIASELRSDGVDCVISAHRSLRSTLLTRFARPRFSVAFDTSAASWLYADTVHYLRRTHESERLAELLTAFDVPSTPIQIPEKVSLEFKQSDINAAESLLANAPNGKKTVVLAPASVWETKRWTEKGFAELAEKLSELNYRVLVMGGPSDAELCEAVAGRAATSIAGRLSIPQSVYLLSRADLLISNDSAPVHFAALVGCPTAAIFGATSPIFGFGPLSPRSVVIESLGIDCRPCRIHGSRSCPLGHFHCMESISSDLVLSEALKLL